MHLMIILLSLGLLPDCNASVIDDDGGDGYRQMVVVRMLFTHAPCTCYAQDAVMDKSWQNLFDTVPQPLTQVTDRLVL